MDKADLAWEITKTVLYFLVGFMFAKLNQRSGSHWKYPRRNGKK